ncbi:2-oxoglutarate (2OG) and Fe(II)-dependent oxygenase superfamily protein [Striga asiatica]|uniref:2-oxoglutarate (2OG) and Fe(II)-dependent oxygenase superfamily protein n=1 Tax=Striga asiatica TaxID=4170 RepID=A0A5A7R5L1_STRAF|nr:2-oxoglutarate (2OG) and Fe(II)-dependent oxygenase superfamily protein [Striga asiatica]
MGQKCPLEGHQQYLQSQLPYVHPSLLDQDYEHVLKHQPVLAISALHKTRDRVELPPHFLHHLQSSTAHTLHCHCREPVRKHGSHNQPYEYLWSQHVYSRDARTTHKRAKQGQGHQSSRPDCESLNTASIVADGAISINSQTSCYSAQHSEGSHSNTVHSSKTKAYENANCDGENWDDN